MKRFCVRCGAEEREDLPIIEGLCPQCFMEVHGLVKVLHPITFVYCPKCYSVKLGKKWIRPETPDEYYSIVRGLALKSLAVTRSEVSIADVTIGSLEMYSPQLKVEVLASIGGRAIVRQLIEIPVIWRKQLCPTCFKRAGGSYEAVVQLRYLNFDNEIEKFKDELTKLFPDDIIEIEDVKHGYDIKVSSPFIAKRIADLIRRKWRSVKIIESYGDQRRTRDGRRYGRLYISVRILNLRPGDYVVLNNRAYIVEKVYEDRIVAVDSGGSRKAFTLHELVRAFTKT